MTHPFMTLSLTDVLRHSHTIITNTLFKRQMTRITPKLIFMTRITPKISTLLFYSSSLLYINIRYTTLLSMSTSSCLPSVISSQPWKTPVRQSIVMYLMKESLIRSIDQIVPAILLFAKTLHANSESELLCLKKKALLLLFLLLILIVLLSTIRISSPLLSGS